MVQAFRFTLDPTAEQARALARLRCPPQGLQLDRRHPESRYRRLAGDRDQRQSRRAGIAEALERRQNDVCVDIETGVVWWPECSKEAYADGIDGAVDAYWELAELAIRQT